MGLLCLFRVASERQVSTKTYRLTSLFFGGNAGFMGVERQVWAIRAYKSGIFRDGLAAPGQNVYFL